MMQVRQKLVTYSSFPVQKAISVPLLTQAFSFGTKVGDPIWQQAALVEDFVGFPNANPPHQPSGLRLFRDHAFLYLAFFFAEEPDRLANPGTGDGATIWLGDMAELHFGAIYPEPWLLQLGVGIGGGRFDSAGSYSSWRALTFSDDAGWYAEIEIPLAMLPVDEGGLAFNLCRQALKRGEHSVWSPLTTRFHEVENFGTLLLCDYNLAYHLRTGKHDGRQLTRADYEALQSDFLVKATTIVHGPWLSNPTESSMTITWETAGRVPAFIEYNKKGSEQVETKDLGYRCGLLPHETLHSVTLTDLEPKTDYEYRLVALSPVVDVPVRHPQVYAFTTIDPRKGEFSFLCVSDLHSNVRLAKAALETEESRQADFLVVLGDSLSHAAGRKAVYDGWLDPLTAGFGARKPLVFVRGNHEMLGIFADEYYACMRHPSGKTWYAFRHGEAFFIVLDSGIDHSDSRLFSNDRLWKEEQAFLRDVVASAAYAEATFRIVLVHIPPYKKEVLAAASFRGMIGELHDPASPAPLPNLMICGHVHHYLRADAGEPHFAPTSDREYSAKHPLRASFPFTIVANANDTVTGVKIRADYIAVKVFEPGGQCRDDFTIRA